MGINSDSAQKYIRKFNKHLTPEVNVIDLEPEYDSDGNVIHQCWTQELRLNRVRLFVVIAKSHGETYTNRDGKVISLYKNVPIVVQTPVVG